MDFHAEEKHAVASALRGASAAGVGGAECRARGNLPTEAQPTLEVPRFEGSPVEGSQRPHLTLQLVATDWLPADSVITTYRGIGHAGTGSWSSVTRSEV